MFRDLVAVSRHAIKTLEVSFLLGGEVPDVVCELEHHLLDFGDGVLAGDEVGGLLAEGVPDPRDLAIIHAKLDVILFIPTEY